MEESSKAIPSLIKRLDVFDGRESRYEKWAEKTLFTVQMYSTEIARIMQGERRPSLNDSPESVTGFEELLDENSEDQPRKSDEVLPGLSGTARVDH